MPETRVVKRYANRKLYDTERSRYVTLEQIAELIRTGEDIKIVDNNTKEDLTAITLAQIIFEEEKRSSFLPLGALRNIIQSSGTSLSQLATQAQEKIVSVFRREGGDKDENGQPLPEGAEPPAEAEHHPVREFLERSQQTFDEWQRRVDERIRHVVESLSPLAGLEKEIRTLSQRVQELEKRLD